MSFQDRFKGKTSAMGKNGVLGLVQESGLPIDKTQGSNFSDIENFGQFKQKPINFEKNANQDSLQEFVKVNKDSQRKNQQVPEEQKKQINIPKPNPDQFKNQDKNPYLVQNPFPINEQQKNNRNGSPRHDKHFPFAIHAQNNLYQKQLDVGEKNFFTPQHFYNKQTQNQQQQMNEYSPNPLVYKQYQQQNPLNYQNQHHQQQLYEIENQNRYYQGNNISPQFKYPSQNQDYENKRYKEFNTPNDYNNRIYTAELPQTHKDLQNSENQIHSSQSHKNGYKPYTLKEYKDMQSNTDYKRGGLGANINTEEWLKKKEKLDKMAQFANDVKARNVQLLQHDRRNSSDRIRQSSGKQQENSLGFDREKALEFAKHIPKPKLKLQNEKQLNTAENGSSNIKKGSTNNNSNKKNDQRFESELERLEKMHNQYLNQVDNIKLKEIDKKVY